MAHDLDVGLLRAFIAVTETGSMTQAGRLLHQTQAAISLKIKRLEELLQAQLFNRSHRGLTLTWSGERLEAYARKMVSLNDEVWSQMTTPAFEGEVRLGVPHDILSTFMPPILRSFNHALPLVRVMLVSTTTNKLLEMLKGGEVDLTLTTELERAKGDAFLLTDRLVWVGAAEGDAHLRDPLPVTLGGPDCLFRPPAVDALAKTGRDWRLICGSSNMDTMCATVEADMAIAPLLPKSLPPGIRILGTDTGLPPLPDFHINLRLPPGHVSDVTAELARHIRLGFQARYPAAA